MVTVAERRAREGGAKILPPSFYMLLLGKILKIMCIYHFNGLKTAMGNTFSAKIYLTHKMDSEFANIYSSQTQERFWGGCTRYISLVLSGSRGFIPGNM